MEQLDILEKLGKVAGIAGIAVGALVLVFGGIIQKNIFPSLTKEHGFRIIRMMIIAASLLAVLGIGVYVYSQTVRPEGLITKNLIGKIINENGIGIASVKVYAAQNDAISDKSDSDGKFILQVEGKTQSYLDIVYEHPQYQTIRKKVAVDFSSKDVDIASETVTMRPNSAPEATQSVQTTNSNEGNTELLPTTNPSPAATNQGASISIIYDDEGTGCNLNVNIFIAGKTYNPQTNPATLTGLPLGTSSYSISGAAYCPAGSCQVLGLSKEALTAMANGNPTTANMLKFFNEINVVNGARYYLVFDSQSCIAGLLDENTYTYFKNASF